MDDQVRIEKLLSERETDYEFSKRKLISDKVIPTVSNGYAAVTDFITNQSAVASKWIKETLDSFK